MTTLKLKKQPTTRLIVWKDEHHGKLIEPHENGDVIISFVTYKDDCLGRGWQANPMTQDKPSRKYWDTPEQALKRFL